MGSMPAICPPGTSSTRRAPRSLQLRSISRGSSDRASRPAARKRIRTDQREGLALRAVNHRTRLPADCAAGGARLVLGGSQPETPLRSRLNLANTGRRDSRQTDVTSPSSFATRSREYLDPGARQRNVQPADVRGSKLGPVVAERITAHYASERNDRAQFVREALDPRGKPEMLLTSADNELEPGISTDGRTLVYVERSPSGNARLRSFDFSGGKRGRSRVCPSGVHADPVTDGRWLVSPAGRAPRHPVGRFVPPSSFGL